MGLEQFLPIIKCKQKVIFLAYALTTKDILPLWLSFSVAYFVRRGIMPDFLSIALEPLHFVFLTKATFIWAAFLFGLILCVF